MTPATALKRFALCVATVIVVAVGALAAIPFLIQPETVREAVKSEIRYATGIDPALRGGVSVSLFPYGSVSFDDVLLSDDEGDGPALAAERLTAQLRLTPLLLGRIEVGEVTLIRPRILVELNDGGHSNWARLVTRLIEAMKPATRAKHRVSFSEIRLVDGTVMVRERGRGFAERFDRVGLSLAWPSISKSFAATGHFTWRGEPLDAAFSLGDFLAALSGERSGLKARLSGKLIKLAFDGHIGYRPTMKLEGTLAADGPSLRRVLEWSGLTPLPGGGFGRFAMKAQTNLVGQTVAFSAVNVELDGNAAEGVLSLTSGRRPHLQGTLAADEIDISPYLASVEMLSGAERAWSRTQIKLDGFKDLEFDLRLSAARVMLGGSRIGRTALTANLRNGKFALNIGESQAFDGVVKGAIGLSSVNGAADFKANLQFSGVDLDKCLAVLLGLRRMEGRGDIVLALAASGKDVHELARTVDGTASLVARNGALTGINVEQLLRRLEQRPLSGGGNFRSGRTPFEKLTVEVKIEDGTAKVADVKLEGAAVRLALDGSASIPERDLDLKGTATLLGANMKDSSTAFALPFVVRGSWDDPVMLPDADSLIRHSGAAAPLWEAVRGARNSRDAVRSAIDQLTRGSGAPLAITPAGGPNRP